MAETQTDMHKPWEIYLCARQNQFEETVQFMKRLLATPWWLLAAAFA